MSKFLLLSCAVLALSACGPKPEAQPVTEYQSVDDIGQVPLVDAQADAIVDNTVVEAVEPVANEVAETESEDAKPAELLEYVNPQSANQLYVVRDLDTGCEFIQIDDSDGVAILPRPDGRGNQRGCRTGSDFKK